ncbi:hypothetical protein GQ42DRAFT_160341 [Ramicandelaber brevisporus]|nr:hypothetical protein GQ42DRAFT_160341 [Ramicandelaber brevisporus]
MDSTSPITVELPALPTTADDFASALQELPYTARIGHAVRYAISASQTAGKIAQLTALISDLARDADSAHDDDSDASDWVVLTTGSAASSPSLRASRYDRLQLAIAMAQAARLGHLLVPAAFYSKSILLQDRIIDCICSATDSGELVRLATRQHDVIAASRITERMVAAMIDACILHKRTDALDAYVDKIWDDVDRVSTIIHHCSRNMIERFLNERSKYIPFQDESCAIGSSNGTIPVYFISRNLSFSKLAAAAPDLILDLIERDIQHSCYVSDGTSIKSDDRPFALLRREVIWRTWLDLTGNFGGRISSAISDGNQDLLHRILSSPYLTTYASLPLRAGTFKCVNPIILRHVPVFLVVDFERTITEICPVDIERGSSYDASMIEAKLDARLIKRIKPRQQLPYIAAVLGVPEVGNLDAFASAYNANAVPDSLPFDGSADRINSVLVKMCKRSVTRSWDRLNIVCRALAFNPRWLMRFVFAYTSDLSNKLNINSSFTGQKLPTLATAASIDKSAMICMSFARRIVPSAKLWLQHPLLTSRNDYPGLGLVTALFNCVVDASKDDSGSKLEWSTAMNYVRVLLNAAGNLTWVNENKAKEVASDIMKWALSAQSDANVANSSLNNFDIFANYLPLASSELQNYLRDNVSASKLDSSVRSDKGSMVASFLAEAYRDDLTGRDKIVRDLLASDAVKSSSGTQSLLRLLANTTLPEVREKLVADLSQPSNDARVAAWQTLIRTVRFSWNNADSWLWMLELMAQRLQNERVLNLTPILGSLIESDIPGWSNRVNTLGQSVYTQSHSYDSSFAKMAPTLLQFIRSQVDIPDNMNVLERMCTALAAITRNVCNATDLPSMTNFMSRPLILNDLSVFYAELVIVNAWISESSPANQYMLRFGLQRLLDLAVRVYGPKGVRTANYIQDVVTLAPNMFAHNTQLKQVFTGHANVNGLFAPIGCISLQRHVMDMSQADSDSASIIPYYTMSEEQVRSAAVVFADTALDVLLESQARHGFRLDSVSNIDDPIVIGIANSVGDSWHRVPRISQYLESKLNNNLSTAPINTGTGLLKWELESPGHFQAITSFFTSKVPKIYELVEQSKLTSQGSESVSVRTAVDRAASQFDPLLERYVELYSRSTLHHQECVQHDDDEDSDTKPPAAVAMDTIAILRHSGKPGELKQFLEKIGSDKDDAQSGVILYNKVFKSFAQTSPFGMEHILVRAVFGSSPVTSSRSSEVNVVSTVDTEDIVFALDHPVSDLPVYKIRSFTSVLRDNSSALLQLLPQQVTLVGKWLLAIALDDLMSTSDRKNALELYVKLPTTTFDKLCSLIGLTIKFDSTAAADANTLIELPEICQQVLVSGLTWTNEPLAPIRFVMQPHVLKWNRGQASLACLHRISEHIDRNAFVHLLAAVLNGSIGPSTATTAATSITQDGQPSRVFVGVSASKEIVRLLASIPDQYSISALQAKFMDSGCHRDVRIAILGSLVKIVRSSSVDAKVSDQIFEFVASVANAGNINELPLEVRVALMLIPINSALDMFNLGNDMPTRLTQIVSFTQELARYDLDEQDLIRWISNVTIPTVLQTAQAVLESRSSSSNENAELLFLVSLEVLRKSMVNISSGTNQALIEQVFSALTASIDALSSHGGIYGGFSDKDGATARRLVDLQWKATCSLLIHIVSNSLDTASVARYSDRILATIDALLKPLSKWLDAATGDFTWPFASHYIAKHIKSIFSDLPVCSGNHISLYKQLIDVNSGLATTVDVLAKFDLHIGDIVLNKKLSFMDHYLGNMASSSDKPVDQTAVDAAVNEVNAFLDLIESIVVASVSNDALAYARFDVSQLASIVHSKLIDNLFQRIVQNRMVLQTSKEKDDASKAAANSQLHAATRLFGVVIDRISSRINADSQDVSNTTTTTTTTTTTATVIRSLYLHSVFELIGSLNLSNSDRATDLFRILTVPNTGDQLLGILTTMVDEVVNCPAQANPKQKSTSYRWMYDNNGSHPSFYHHCDTLKPIAHLAKHCASEGRRELFHALFDKCVAQPYARYQESGNRVDLEMAAAFASVVCLEQLLLALTPSQLAVALHVGYRWYIDTGDDQYFTLNNQLTACMTVSTPPTRVQQLVKYDPRAVSAALVEVCVDYPGEWTADTLAAKFEPLHGDINLEQLGNYDKYFDSCLASLTALTLQQQQQQQQSTLAYRSDQVHQRGIKLASELVFSRDMIHHLHLDVVSPSTLCKMIWQLATFAPDIHTQALNIVQASPKQAVKTVVQALHYATRRGTSSHDAFEQLRLQRTMAAFITALHRQAKQTPNVVVQEIVLRLAKDWYGQLYFKNSAECAELGQAYTEVFRDCLASTAHVEIRRLAFKFGSSPDAVSTTDI